MSVRTIVKSIQDIMRKDDGVDGDDVLVGDGGGQFGRVFSENRRHRFGGRAPLKGPPAGQQLVQDGPEGKQIGP